MIIWIYATMFVFGIVMFFLAFTNALKVTKESQVTFMLMAFVTSVLLLASSFNIENPQCKWVTDAFQCSTYSTYDMAMVILNFLFMILSLLCLVIYSLEILKEGSGANGGIS